MEMKIL
ncbi:Protein of unknown function [Pyronema omphalodes CBS 100304]|nr:Protein of unknown function [Pyronema omphalodes CBS 100304]